MSNPNENRKGTFVTRKERLTPKELAARAEIQKILSAEQLKKALNNLRVDDDNLDIVMRPDETLTGVEKLARIELRKKRLEKFKKFYDNLSENGVRANLQTKAMFQKMIEDESEALKQLEV